jgi:hypothetical protein
MPAKKLYLGNIVMVGGFRISRHVASFTLDPSREEVDSSDIEDRADTYELGVWKAALNFTGQAEGVVERHFIEALAAAASVSQPLTAPLVGGNGTAGDLVAVLDGCNSDLKLTGERGKLRGFTAKFYPHDRFMYHQLLYTAFGGAGVTAAVNGTAVQLGAIAAEQELVVAYQNPNFPAVEGTTPTLDAKIQSATDSAFTTPTDRITLPQRTATVVGSVHKLAGPITDTWWRFAVTAVGGTATPKFWPYCTGGVVSI